MLGGFSCCRSACASLQPVAAAPARSGTHRSTDVARFMASCAFLREYIIGVSWSSGRHLLGRISRRLPAVPLGSGQDSVKNDVEKLSGLGFRWLGLAVEKVGHHDPV